MTPRVVREKKVKDRYSVAETARSRAMPLLVFCTLACSACCFCCSTIFNHLFRSHHTWCAGLIMTLMVVRRHIETWWARWCRLEGRTFWQGTISLITTTPIILVVIIVITISVSTVWRDDTTVCCSRGLRSEFLCWLNPEIGIKRWKSSSFFRTCLRGRCITPSDRLFMDKSIQKIENC